MNKRNFCSYRFLLILLLFLSASMTVNTQKANAQLKEPSVRAIEEPITPYGQGYRNRLGINVVINNFKFGVTGIYARAVAPFTEMTFTAGITGLRDVSAQNFIYFWTRKKIVPNRYKRALGFIFMVGVERRLFPYAIDDNFRFFASADFGPSLAFTYPYYDDAYNKGYRDRMILVNKRGQLVSSRFIEDTKSFFGGWGKGDWHTGFAGNLSIGVDIGSDFDSQVSLEIGYFFYYFPSGLQLMEPYKKKDFKQIPEESLPPALNKRGIKAFRTEGQAPFYDTQSFFGTPQIKISYSWWL